MSSIGLLRDRITFDRRDLTADGGGGGSIHWTPALVAWGLLMPERGQEQVAAGRLQSSSMATLKIRSSRAAREIDASYRATDRDGITYQVRAISNPDGKNRFLEIILERGVGA